MEMGGGSCEGTAGGQGGSTGNGDTAFEEGGGLDRRAEPRNKWQSCARTVVPLLLSTFQSEPGEERDLFEVQQVTELRDLSKHFCQGQDFACVHLPDTSKSRDPRLIVVSICYGTGSCSFISQDQRTWRCTCYPERGELPQRKVVWRHGPCRKPPKSCKLSHRQGKPTDQCLSL